MEDINLSKKLVKSTLLKSLKEIILHFMANIFYRGIFLLIPVIIGIIVDYVNSNNYEMAIKYSIIGVILAFFSQFISVFKTFTWHYLYNKLFRIITNESLKKTYSNSLYSLSRFNSSSFINIMSNDINLICSFVCDVMSRIVYIVEIFVVIGYFYYLNIYIGFISSIVLIVIMLMIYFSKNKNEMLNSKKLAKLDERNGVFNEVLTCMKEIKSFNLFLPTLNRVNDATFNYTNSFVELKDQESLIKDITILLVNIQRWVLLLAGLLLITHGNMMLGTIVVIYNYHGELLTSYSELILYFQNLKIFSVSAKRLSRLLIYSHEVSVLSNKKKVDINGDLIFKNIIYGDRKTPYLNDVSFVLKRGLITGLTGKEGSGKSSVLDLILKLNCQHEGNICINNTDIYDIPNSDYFYLISTIGKDPIFLNLSIKENLSANSENFDEIINVCRELDIHKEIVNLPNGYDTNLSECRNKLSTSTKTMLIFARILSVKSKIILIDESFIHLNKKEKDVIINKLIQLKENKIIIIVSSEKSILSKCDEIITFEDGKVRG